MRTRKGVKIIKLLTKEITDKLPKLYSTENIPTEDKKIICKFFTPWTSWTWYVAEGEKQENGDWVFFGLVVGFEKEWGNFALSELEEVEGPFGLRIERDRYFSGKIPA